MMKTKPSPVVRASVRLMGKPPHPCVVVRFQTRAELDELLTALHHLRDSAGNDADHVHLQDHHDGRGAAPGITEITFHRPGKDPDEGETLSMQDYVRCAQRLTRGEPRQRVVPGAGRRRQQ